MSQEQFNKRMNKALEVFVIVVMVVASILIVYQIGYDKGTSDVIDNQIITNQSHDEGTYVSKYNQQEYTYWYE